jgi:hypothetical protein
VSVWSRAVAAAKRTLARRRKDERLHTRIPPRPFIRDPAKLPPMRDNEGDEVCEPFAEFGRWLASR